MRERWLSRRAVFLHVGCLLFVPFCIAATWWQITRAQDGNGLSYLYTVEWPVFAVVGIYFWWQFLHTDYNTVGLKGMRNQTAAAPTSGVDTGSRMHLESEAPQATMSHPHSARLSPSPVITPPSAIRSAPAIQPTAFEDENPELVAYNARLAALSTSGGKTWRKPEIPIARRPQ